MLHVLSGDLPKSGKKKDGKNPSRFLIQGAGLDWCRSISDLDRSVPKRKQKDRAFAQEGRKNDLDSSPTFIRTDFERSPDSSFSDRTAPWEPSKAICKLRTNWIAA